MFVCELIDYGPLNRGYHCYCVGLEQVPLEEWWGVCRAHHWILVTNSLKFGRRLINLGNTRAHGVYVSVGLLYFFFHSQTVVAVRDETDE